MISKVSSSYVLSHQVHSYNQLYIIATERGYMCGNNVDYDFYHYHYKTHKKIPLNGIEAFS